MRYCDMGECIEVKYLDKYETEIYPHLDVEEYFDTVIVDAGERFGVLEIPLEKEIDEKIKRGDILNLWIEVVNVHGVLNFQYYFLPYEEKN